MNETVGTDETLSMDRLVRDFKVVVRDAETLIKSTAGDLGEKVRDARERLTSSLESAKFSYRDVEEKALQGARATDQIIREHPYESIGVAFGMGLLFGLLLTR